MLLILLLTSVNAFSHPCEGKVTHADVEVYFTAIRNEIDNNILSSLTTGHYRLIPALNWNGECERPFSLGTVHHYLSSEKGQLLLADYQSHLDLKKMNRKKQIQENNRIFEESLDQQHLENCQRYPLLSSCDKS